MSHQESKVAKFNRVWVPKIGSVGGAIVVVGALFKLMHWPGAAPMLVVGMGVEAVLFLLGLTVPSPPVEKHYDWENIYPQLLDKEAEGGAALPAGNNTGSSTTALVAMDQMLAEADFKPEAFKNFGAGIDKLNASAAQMAELSNTVAASNKYADTLDAASTQVESFNKSLDLSVKAMGNVASATQEAEVYHNNIQAVNKNLGALNAVYEMEMKDANEHMKAMNKFYGNLTVAMSNMAEAGTETEVLRKEVSQLTDNMSKMNTVYGNMLTAMKG